MGFGIPFFSILEMPVQVFYYCSLLGHKRELDFAIQGSMVLMNVVGSVFSGKGTYLKTLEKQENILSRMLTGDPELEISKPSSGTTFDSLLPTFQGNTISSLRKDTQIVSKKIKNKKERKK